MVKPANGYVPSNALVVIETGHYQDRAYTTYTETATAAAYNKARSDNPAMYLSPPLGGYRSYEDQANLKAHPSEYGSSLPSSKIAGPGNSTHGWGTCVDIGPENAWFQVNCAKYGFTRKSPAGENNHYEFQSPTWAPALPQLTPSERIAGPAGVNARSAASTVGTTILAGKGIASNGIADFGVNGRGYVLGDSVTVGSVTSNIWYYALDLKAYFAAAAFKSAPSVTGLINLTPVVIPTVTQPPVTVPQSPIEVIEPPVTVPETPVTASDTPITSEPVSISIKPVLTTPVTKQTGTVGTTGKVVAHVITWSAIITLIGSIIAKIFVH